MTGQRTTIGFVFLIWAYGVLGQWKCLINDQDFLPQAPPPAQMLMRTPLQVRVVVHVVWFTTRENISDAQIYSQIDALNRDFNQANFLALPLEFRALAAQGGITFCLAEEDPFGRPTTGITRTQTTRAAIGIALESGQRQAIHYSALGGQDGWPPERYINIWVGGLGGLYGRASMPGSARYPAEDGIVIDPQYFGMVGSVRYPQHLGRTLTHEMGHYLGLQHPWGTVTLECAEDDGIADTPPQAGPHLGCPPHPQPGCSGPVMFMNFMDLVDDPCLLAFTAGQVQVMHNVLTQHRSGLLNPGCPDFQPALPDTDYRIIYDRTSRQIIILYAEAVQAPLDVELYNLPGQKIFQERSSHHRTFIIPVPQLASGIYFLVLRQGGNVVTKKVFIRA